MVVVAFAVVVVVASSTCWRNKGRKRTQSGWYKLSTVVVWDSTRTPEPKFLQRQRGLAKDGSPWLTTLQNPRIPHSLVCPSPYSQFEIQIKQGCKLSPTLFSFLRGRLFAALETTFGADQVVKFLTGYANDLTLHRTIRSVKDLQENSQARRRPA